MKEYLKRYRSHFLMTGLFVFLLHGAKLNSDIIGIDTEDLIFLGEDFYGGWLHTGRHGLVFLKYLFGNTEYNPYFTGIMTLLLFTAAVAVFLVFWDWKGGGTSLWGVGFGALLWVSHPVMVEQFYFSLQSMEICLALGLTALALCFVFRWVEERRPVFAVSGVGILLLTFSSYQAFVVLYIFGTASMVLLQAVREISAGKKLTEGALVKRMLSHCVLFVVAFLLNTLITRIFFDSSDYLGNQIVWGDVPIMDGLFHITAHIFRTFTGYGSHFYSAGLGVLAVWDFVLLVVFLNKKCRNKRVHALILCCYMALLATLFILTVILGAAPTIRSQLTLPAVTGFLGYLCSSLTGLLQGAGQNERRFRMILGCAVLICLVTGIGQAKVTEGLYYTDSCRYEQDIALGRAIIERMEQVNPEKKALPVLVIGGREFQGNHSCIMGEVIGRSFFNYDRDVNPNPFWSTKRVLGFLHTLGASYIQIPMERVEEGMEYGFDMPQWPAEGSVQVRNGMIIIKLSED